MEVRYDPSQVPKGQVHKDNYLHSLVNNKDNLVGRVVVFIFRGLSTREWWTDWLMDLSQHKFSMITMARSATLMNIVLTFTQN